MRKKSSFLFLLLKILGLIGMIGQLLEMIVGDEATKAYIDEAVEDKLAAERRNAAEKNEES